MKSILLLVGSILISFVISCVPEANYDPYTSKRKTQDPSQRERPAGIEHTYELQVVDINDTPITEAMVKFSIKSGEELNIVIVKDSVVYTNSEGKLLQKVLVAPVLRSPFGNSYNSFFEYQVTKEGYFPKKGQLWSFYNGRPAAPAQKDPDLIANIETEIQSKTIKLVRPIDYFRPTFLSSKVGIELKDKILPFIELKIFESLTDCYMQARSIDLIEFKGKKYLKFKFVNTNVYNSLRLTKYDIAKILFDEVIRKILDPLNSHISDPNRFYGYDLTILAGTKSFARKSDTPTLIEYRFIIPQTTVRKYKDKDISGQDVLNESIILMDDERIELKLQ